MEIKGNRGRRYLGVYTVGGKVRIRIEDNLVIYEQHDLDKDEAIKIAMAILDHARCLPCEK